LLVIGLRNYEERHVRRRQGHDTAASCDVVDASRELTDERVSRAPIVLDRRYLLVLDDGDPADPAAFLTAVPDWREGDEFLAGTDLRKLRIGAIADEDPPPRFHGIWIVAPA
jgi:hypothetical protein